MAGICGGILLLLASGAHADPKSDALFKRAIATAKSAKSLTATVTITTTASGKASNHTAAVRLLKPNLAQVSVHSTDPNKGLLMLLTGKDAFLVIPAKKQYQQLEKVTDPAQSPLSGIGTPLSGAFFDSNVLKSLTAGATVKYGGKRTVGGLPYETVSVKRTVPAPLTVTAYFGGSGLCEGVELLIPAPAPAKGAPATAKKLPGRITWWLKGVKLNTAMPASEFAYSPPAGYTRMSQGGQAAPK